MATNAADLLREANAHKEQGNTCYRNQQYKRAISHYDEAIKKCPKSKNFDIAIFYQNRATAHEMLGMWNEAKADCNKALENNPLYSKAFYRRAKLHEINNDLQDCLEDATAALVLERCAKKEVKEIAAFCDRIATQGARNDASRYIETREHSLPSPCIIKLYFQPFLNDPVKWNIPKINNPKGYLKAKDAFETEDYDEIIPACCEEINMSSSDINYKAEALLLRGTFHALSGNFKQGKLDFDTIINDEDITDEKLIRANAFLKRGSIRIHLGDNQRGFDDFAESEKLYPNNTDLLCERGELFITMQQYSNALKEFEKAIELAPNHAIAHLKKLSTKYCMLKNKTNIGFDYTTLVDEIKNCIEKFPDCSEFYILAVGALGSIDRFEEANLYSEKSIACTPERADLYVFRGELLLHWKKDIQAVIDLMMKAIELDSKCRVAFEELGKIATQHISLDRGIDFFETGIPLCKVPVHLISFFKLRNMAVAEKNVRMKLSKAKDPSEFESH